MQKVKNIEFLDFAKGFAIFAILIYHYLSHVLNGHLAKVIMLGGAGVHLFFLLSGFGLTLSVREPIRTGILGFYKKRFLKILIPYFTFVIFIYIVTSYIPIYKVEGHSSTYVLLGHMLFFKMFDPSIMESYGGHLWFMSTLIQFYIFFPLINHIRYTKSNCEFITFSLCLSLTYSLFISFFDLNGSRVYNSFFLQYLWEFSLGMYFAERFMKSNFQFWNIGILKSLTLTIIFYLLMAIVTIKFQDFGRTFNDIPSSIGFASLTVLSYSLIRQNNLIKRFFLFIGSISYEIYLTHIFIYSLLNYFYFHDNKPDLFLVLCILVPSAILVGYSYKRFFLWFDYFFANKLIKK